MSERTLKITLSVLLIIATLTLSGCGLFHETEAPPKITEGEFPFYVEFIYNGETYKYEDSIVCSFDGYDHSAWFKKPRTWFEKFKSSNDFPTNKTIAEEYNSISILDKSRINKEARLMLSCGRAEYYMGEEEYTELSKPCFYYLEKHQIDEKTSEWDTTVLNEEQLKEYFGLEIIRFEFGEPINNEFEYTE